MTAGALDVRLPAFGQDLDEALLVEWVAQVGDHVERGDVVATVETAKASTEVLAERAGVLVEHVALPGAIVATGDVLYRVEPEDPERGDGAARGGTAHEEVAG